MYVCIYIYVHVFLYIQLYMYVYVKTYQYIFTYVYVDMHIATRRECREIHLPQRSHIATRTATHLECKSERVTHFAPLECGNSQATVECI